MIQYKDNFNMGKLWELRLNVKKPESFIIDLKELQIMRFEYHKGGNNG